MIAGNNLFLVSRRLPWLGRTLRWRPSNFIRESTGWRNPLSLKNPVELKESSSWPSLTMALDNKARCRRDLGPEAVRSSPLEPRVAGTYLVWSLELSCLVSLNIECAEFVEQGRHNWREWKLLHTNTLKHIRWNTYIHTYIYVCVCVCVLVCGGWCVRARTHTHTHTRMFICVVNEERLNVAWINQKNSD